MKNSILYLSVFSLAGCSAGPGKKPDPLLIRAGDPGFGKESWRDEDRTDYLVDKVKEYITDNKLAPFFLYDGLHQPHVPRAPHGRFVEKITMGARGGCRLLLYLPLINTRFI